MALSVPGCASEGPRGPLPGYEPDPDLYATNVFELVELAPGGLRVAVDHLVFHLTPEATHGDALRIAERVSGTLEGRHPALAAYQLDVGSTTIAQLDAAIETVLADPAVAGAGYDHEVVSFSSADLSICPPPSDNQGFHDDDRCPFEDTRYDNAHTIYKRLERELAVSPVALGIVDTGVQYTHPQLRTARLINAHASGGVLDERVAPYVVWKGDDAKRDPHGTEVAGIMIAANDSVSMNGLFTAFAEKRNLVIGRPEYANGETVGFNTRVAIEAVLDAGAQVVNLSIGSRELGPSSEDVALARTLFALHPDVVFVVAAPYVGAFELTASNSMFAGADLDNVITVGSVLPCEPLVPMFDQSWGRIDISAQGSDFPRLSLVDPTAVKIGPGYTSMAAPQVSALAGVLRSIAPELTAAQIKDAILDDAAVGPPAPFGERYLDLAAPIARAALEHGPLPAEERALLDDEGDGLDPIGIIVGRLCGRLVYAIEDVGETEMTGTDIAREDTEPAGESVFGIVNPGGFGWSVLASDARRQLTLVTTRPLDLGVFALGSELDDVALVHTQDPEGDFATGYAVSGTLEIERCEIIERTAGESGDPLVAFVRGHYEADLEYLAAGSTAPEPRDSTGTFELPFAVTPLPDDPQLEHLERICVGGTLYAG